MKNPVRFQKSVKFACAVLLLSATIACQSSANSSVSVNAANSNADAAVDGVGAAMPLSNSTESNTAAQQKSPDALVADLYKQHDAQKSPFFFRRKIAHR